MLNPQSLNSTFKRLSGETVEGDQDARKHHQRNHVIGDQTKHVKTLVRETNRKIQPSKIFKVTEEKVMTTIWLGGFGLINLSKQLLGRRASQGLNLPTGKILIAESPLGKLVFSQEKSEVHSSFAQSVTLDLNSLEAPDQVLNKWIQLAGKSTPITALSFSSSSKRYYQAHKEEKLIVPSRAKDDDKTKWRTFWAFLAKQARKIMKADIPECPILEKLEKLMKKLINRYQIPLRI
ncbi:unnamed protein product [Ambrosiozyma monospora]|uniref:Unnamed protein product n=1 Tax=Ambrosiozyma monospora TaxID=43982 RepID=A0ACB5SSQ0_AMBMO|nr:unnamed protein product [Ambrosiozyma monospora]